jgi:ribonuclease HII
MLRRAVAYTYRIGADENGLGARLGPLVVTAVLARTSERGEATLKRKLPKRVRSDLDDSKALVSHQNVELGEAWARAVCTPNAANPDALFAELCLEKSSTLTELCPSHLVSQCWSAHGEAFVAEAAQVARVRTHLAFLAERGVEILKVQSSVVCTKRLNNAREGGHNRFVSDLHAMERLVIALRGQVPTNVRAICGKVGGIAEYSKFFGPLSGSLHAIMEQGRAQSSYRFPGLGELHFVRDADAADPLVMLASLVGKYLRELLMGRVSRFYVPPDAEQPSPSGYHDPRTSRFVAATALLRRQRRVPDGCFERARDAIATP